MTRDHKKVSIKEIICKSFSKGLAEQLSDESIYISYIDFKEFIIGNVLFTGVCNVHWDDGTKNFNKNYVKNGKMHREDGPARIDLNSNLEYYFLNGNLLSKEDWYLIVNNLQHYA